MSQATMLISCPDNRGITASITGFIYDHNGNIIHADQHIDAQSNTFFMRIEWSLDGFGLGRDQIVEAFSPIAQKFNMIWDLHFDDQKPKMAVFVSKHLHCLVDILWRHKEGQFNCEIPLIISNHPDAQSIAHEFDIRFHSFPINAKNKSEFEKKQLELLENAQIDFVILARYHQILTKSFVQAYYNRIINIHHSFLPAFAGKNPYLQAFQKGVKIIGATSHYVIEQLDEGPIIEQDTVRISHRDAVEDLICKGQDLEKAVLSRAIRLHLEHKVLCYGNKTVVFD